MNLSTDKKEKIVFDLEIFQKGQGFHWRADFHEENTDVFERINQNTYALYVLEFIKKEIVEILNDSGRDLIKNPKL